MSQLFPRDPTADLRSRRTMYRLAGQAQNPNVFYCGPAAAPPNTPSFRAIVAADIAGAIVGALPLTTKGDILGYDTVPDRIPIGSDGRALFADSSLALGTGYKGATQTYFVNVTPVSNSGMGLSTLMQVTVAAGLVNHNVGDSIEIEALFGLGAAGGGVIVTAVVGGVTILTLTPNGSGGNMVIRIRILRITSTTQVISCEAISNVGVSVATAFATAANLANSLNIQFTGQASGGSNKVTQLSLHCKLCLA